MIPFGFTGAVELASLAKSCHVITDARVGLADICAVVLHCQLDKPTHLRISTNWTMAELSAEQIQYAIRDAWVSLQIYNQLSKIKIPGPLSEPALPGTQVILRHSDGQSIAHGWISHQIGGSSHKGVNITKT